MTKPHEETWTTDGRWISASGEPWALAEYGSTGSDEERARLAAQAPAMARLLLEGRKEVGADWCRRVDAVLRAAGVLP